MLLVIMSVEHHPLCRPPAAVRSSSGAGVLEFESAGGVVKRSGHGYGNPSSEVSAEEVRPQIASAG